MKNFLEEFKAFAMKGNVLELAVAVVIGAAFGKIVTSIVEDIITPLIGMIGSFDFSTWTLGGQIRIGSFLNNVLNFIIVALSIFVAVKFLNKITSRKIVSTPSSEQK